MVALSTKTITMKYMDETRRRSSAPHPRVTREGLIAALVPPPATGHPLPSPRRLPALPPLQVPTVRPDELQVGFARLDLSGRLHNRTLMKALNWHPGHRVEFGVVHDAVIVTSTPTGLHVISAGEALTLPATARRLAGIDIDLPVALAAIIAQQILLIHPISTVAQLLSDHHRRLAGSADAH